MFTNPKYGTSPSSYTRDSYIAQLSRQDENGEDISNNGSSYGSRRASDASAFLENNLSQQFYDQDIEQQSNVSRHTDEQSSLLSSTPRATLAVPPDPSQQPPLSTVFATENASLISSQPHNPPFAVTESFSSKPPWKPEIKILVAYTLPIFGTHILEYSLMIVTVISVGHLGTVELASASLASMTANVVALSIIQGMACALDTLCPQSYTSSNPKKTSLHALRSAFLILLIFIPQAIILWHSEKLLLLLRQTPEVSYNASRYLRVMIFGIPGYGLFECCRRWLQAQGLMLAPTLAVCLTAPFNIFLNFLLVWGPESINLGFIGAPLATAISMNLMFVFVLVYCIFFAPRDAWSGFSWEIFRNLKLNISLGFAGILIVASEWWSWEIVALAASYLGPEAMAAQSILLTTSSLTYQFAYALSAAAAVRVGNLIGAQFISLAKFSSKVSMILGVLIGLLNSTVLLIARDHWGKMFTGENAVIERVAQILPIVALFQMADSLSGVTGGLLRGIGRSPAGAFINLTSYYVIGLPVGLALTFSKVDMGLIGLWIGLTTALAYTSVLTVVYIMRVNWEKIGEAARERLEVDYVQIAGDDNGDYDHESNSSDRTVDVQQNQNGQSYGTINK